MRKVYIRQTNANLWCGIDEYGMLLTKKHPTEKELMEEISNFKEETMVVNKGATC